MFTNLIVFFQGYRDNPKINAIMVTKGTVDGKCWLCIVYFSVYD